MAKSANEAMIFDAIRTPRGKGKKDGSLHEVKPVTLLSGVLQELQRRHDFDTGEVEDVVMGCVTPSGEQGSEKTWSDLDFENGGRPRVFRS